MNLREKLSSFSVAPQEILKIVISISVVLLVIWLFMMSRMEFTGSSAETVEPVGLERVDSLRTSLNEQEQPVDTVRKGSSSFSFNALITFLVLMAFLGVAWFWSNKKSRLTSEKSCEVIGGQMLGQGAQLKIIEINNEIWVIGVTSGSVNLLHRYSKNDWSGPIVESNFNQSSFQKIFKRET